jgi:hypothetical protein
VAGASTDLDLLRLGVELRLKGELPRLDLVDDSLSLIISTDFFLTPMSREERRRGRSSPCGS